MGATSLFFGIVVGVTAILLRLFGVKHLVETPLPIFSALFIIVGVQMILFGIIGEMLMRTYYESQARKPYRIAEVASIV